MTYLVEADCQNCGQHFLSKRCRKEGKFCSLACYQQFRGFGTINSDGYLCSEAGAGGKHYFVHRKVMEGVLGRPLKKDEKVHHLNGNRLDNRPENLELWSVNQPPGQRVADKLKWARELLLRYEHADSIVLY